MSLSVNKVIAFRHPTLESISFNEQIRDADTGLPLLGQILQDGRHVWHAKGPCLEVRNTKTGCKVGAWVFGCILKDSNTRIMCVEEVQRPHGRLSLLAVGIDCTISGGIICIFDVISSKVIRAILVEDKITMLHVIDPGIEDLNLPGPLRNFDGILAVGTEGGSVFLVDICRQICEEALFSTDRRDELNPCHLVILTSKKLPKIEYYKEISVRDGNHLAIHLNAVLDSQTEHFILKGPKGDDRIYVNKEEVITSGLYYCSQLTSLLVGYNFGAFQLWDLTTLTLVYTSPVCEEHLPVTKFAIQEPADDPRAFCYVWVSYSKSELDQTGFPFAVMYSLCYDSKEYHEGYGFLYQDFQHCSVRFQVELGPLEELGHGPDPKWGCCLGLQPITKLPSGKEQNAHFSTGDTLALCLISWTVWYNQADPQTFILIFDLNQWYKEQMPNFSKWKNCVNYLLRLSLTDLIHMTGHKGGALLDVKMDPKALRQFVGIQRLEEHFYPTSMSFDLWTLRENDIILFHNKGLQQALLYQIESTGPLCLIRPNDVARQVLSSGLTPLFNDETVNSSFSTSSQRELVLNVGLEHQLVGWLCKCASEWANGSFASAGCSLEFLIEWAFQRAVVLKNNCDKYCAPLFDYSQSQLDNNTTSLLNTCIRQINNLCTLYTYIVNKCASFLSCPDLIEEQRNSLQMVSVYFEVLQWLINVGLLPEYPPSMYPQLQNLDKIGAPYPVHELTKFYNEKRTQLQLLNEETFANTDSLLFIDNLINHDCGGSHLQKQWQEDNGNGLYPPPSLQSLIRTYLIDVADIKHKHSLVIYLFLDLAMALEKSRYSPVIMYLIKFPAVFKVSTSIIKITQAFWQLDHGDFATAMEQLLDPFVLGEDLQPWHHTIAMRSLCVQKQYHFALLYIQTRRPPMKDETDFLTAISLFVANKMLDEAFYFMKQHQNDVNSPSSDELQVFYYLLRSRYLEAFDFHAGVKKINDRQGLMGQSNVSITDQIVRIFKSLLPDVSRNLVEYVRKERKNLWKEVSKPTPLSVFVHNSHEQIQYKSTLIHAALAKAKHTFHDRLNDTRFNELLTEETPFLRTPQSFKNGTRMATNVITPNIIELNENGEGIGPSPPKKLKLTPRLSTGSQNKINASAHSIMLTPIVKRKTSFQQDQSLLSGTTMNVCTPQSILKGRNIEDFDVMRGEISQRNSSIGLSSRRSLSRTPRPQHVQFKDSFSDQSSKPAESISLEDRILQRSSLSSRDISYIVSSKDDTNSTTDETFYSPNSSYEKVSHESKQEDVEGSELMNNTEAMEDVEKQLNPENERELRSNQSMGEDFKINKSVREDLHITESMIDSPRGRKSYKRSYKEMSPVRFSPRLAKAAENQIETPASKKLLEEPKLDESVDTEMSPADSGSISTDSFSAIQSPRLMSRVKGRRSLSRQVLEQNTFLKLCTPVSTNTTLSKDTVYSKTEKTVAVEKSPRNSSITTVETSLKISDTSRIDPHSPLTIKSHTVEGSLSKKNFFESTTDFNTSSESDISFDYNSQSQVPELKLSDSVNEYMKSIYSRLAEKDNLDRSNIFINSPTFHTVTGEKRASGEKVDKSAVSINKSQGLEEPSLVINESISGKQVDEGYTADKFEELNVPIYKSQGLAEPYLLVDKSISEKQVVEGDTGDKLKDSDVSIYKSQVFEQPSLLHNEIILNRQVVDSFSQTNTTGLSDSLNEYKTHLQSETERSKNEMQSDSFLRQTETEVSECSHNKDRSEEVISMEIYEDLSSGTDDRESYTDPSSFNELELNVFETTGSGNLTPLKRMELSTVSFASPNSDSYFVPDSEKAFIEHTPRKEGAITEDAIVISSSDDENTSISRSENRRSSSLPSKSSGNLQVSYEQNIQMDDNSRSLNDTISSEELNDHCQDIVEELPQTITVDKEISSVLMNEMKSNNEDFEKVTGISINLDNAENINKELVPETEINKNDEEKWASANFTENVGYPEQIKNSESMSEESVTAEPEIKITINKTLHSLREKGVEREIETSNILISQENVEDDRVKRANFQKYYYDDQLNVTLKPNVNEPDNLEQHDQNVEINATVPEEIMINEGISDINKDEQLSQTIKESVAEKTFEGVERPPDPKVYSSKGTKKINVEDSSSDTTEGETFRQEIVTAQVHTPSKKRTEEPLIRRITRRSTSLMAQNLDIVTTMAGTDSSNDTKELSPAVTIIQDDVFTTEKPSHPSPSHNSGRITKPRRLSQSSNGTIDCQASTSKETLEAPKVMTLLRRTRSASVTEVKTYSRKRVSKRSSSVDEKVEDCVLEPKPKPTSKARSVSQMPIISEELKGGKYTKENYTTSRRMTRKQASMMKGIPTPTDVTAEDDSGSEKTIDVEDFDPIMLLEKEHFQGEPDPEEKKVYETSPSNSTASSLHRPARRKSRSASITSDISLPPSVSHPPTPEKRPRKSQSRVGSPSTSGVKTRSRKQSETSSVVSEKTDPATPPKRPRRKQNDESEASSTKPKRTRSRTDSVSSAKSDASNSPKKNIRTRRLVSAKTDLPEIQEEKNDLTKPSHKKNAKKKN
ncbi:hypothetical protein JTB14_007634 [Gonioctena quinquepunctata]|nr:hypothetical protein JTB14_007634 [Gonioctena quinquepunctata]